MTISQVLMLQRLKSICPKTMLISALAVSLVACTDTTTPTASESATPTTTEATPTTTATTPAPSSSTQTTSSPNLSSLGINDLKEIKFDNTNPGKSLNGTGSFDGVNGSAAANTKISGTTPVKASGWAVLPAKVKPADNVIITYGDNNSLVTVANVNIQRADVAQALKNQSYAKSGWVASFDPSTLPSGKVELKAWAYNSATKQASQLSPTHEVVVTK